MAKKFYNQLERPEKTIITLIFLLYMFFLGVYIYDRAYQSFNEITGFYELQSQANFTPLHIDKLNLAEQTLNFSTLQQPKTPLSPHSPF